ncbi:hypothetical protein [Oceanicaulis sp. MMSF_3324]|uniref:hypothetical protein n=1 Tax=Oceanicaulis sp. MMSF_3324 TaxID=3046702 RepID=UPI002740290E|nr:hypothetical protein [Oceanicaulis sp. MMSF_3324]
MVISSNLLGAWYGAQSAVALSRTTAVSTSASNAQSASQSRNSDVLPPWDARGEIVALDVLKRSALGNGVFFDKKLGDFADLDVGDDEKQLFAMYQGLRRLQALGAEAAEKSTLDTRRDFLDRRFQEGLDQLSSFFADLDLEGVSVLKGEELSKAESSLAISRGTSEYTTPIIHSGAFDAEVANFQGDISFTINVKKSGVNTPIAIDLANMGATPRTLDNVADHINTELEAAGMLSRVERVKIGEKDENGIIPGDNFGFKIKGILTETVSFEPSAGNPAVYMAGVSGDREGAGGQLTKYVDIAGGGTAAFMRRIEADGSVTESTVAVPGGEEGETETRTSTDSNPLRILDSVQGPDGGLYMVGYAENGVAGQSIKGEQDLILMRYDTTGKQVWARTLGAAGSAEGASIALDANGNVVVAGSVEGALGDTTELGGSDSLVSKFSADGVEQWTKRFGGNKDDSATAVSVGADGTIYVAGQTNAPLGGVTNAGGTDGYVRAIDGDGNVVYTRAAGASAGTDRAQSIAQASDGGLIIASEVEGRAVLTKYAAGDDGTGAAVWSMDLGDLEGGRIGEVTVGDDGAIYLAGSAGGAFAPSAPLTANSGGRDAFLMKITDGPTANVDFTTFLGSAEDNSASSVTVNNGVAYISGKTSGALPGQTQTGDRNAFVAGFDTTSGAVTFTQQLSGRGGLAEANAVVVDPTGDNSLDKLGFPTGEVRYADSRVITARSSVREGDHFYISVDGGRKKKISIDADETMRSLTFKLNAVLVLDGTSDVRRSSNGDMLRIKPREGVKVELFAGDDGRDALSGLGLPEGSIIGKASLLDKEESTSDAPEIFAMELPASMSISSKEGAAKALEALSKAQSVIQRAYRDLTTDPALKALLEGPQAGKRGGTAPAYLTAQVANYQAGLDRLLGGSGSTTLGLF